MGQTYSAQALEKDIRTFFYKSLPTEKPVMVKNFCEEVNSTNKAWEKYDHLDDAPQLEEFKGEVTTTRLFGRDYTIYNLPYTKALSFSRDAWRRNQNGSFKLKLQQFARHAHAHPNKLVIDLIEAGESTNCVDGTPFFGDSHTAYRDEGSNVDNLVTGTGTTTAQVQTDLNTGLETLYGFKNAAGEPFHGDGFTKLIALHGPALLKPIREALSSTLISNTDNALKGVATPMLSPRISGNSWYLIVVDAGLRPIIFQKDQPLTIESSGESDYDLWVVKRQIMSTISVASGCGYGFWQSAIKIKNS